jgi:hypothetical protein
MATLAENIQLGNAAIAATHPDEDIDAATAAMDAITSVIHAGYSNALAHEAERIADPDAEGPLSFIFPEVTSAEAFFDDIVANAKRHFLAEQNGEGE